MAKQESEVPYFHTELRQRLKPRARKLFEEYVGLPPDQVENNIFAIRDKAWARYPFPCLGQFGFLHLAVSGFPWYDGLLAKLKAGGTILDVGCGLGQDLRFLAFDGVPIEVMRATDAIADLWELGLELFRDKEHFEGKFIARNSLEEAEASQSISPREAHDVILVNQVFHLFDWETQVKLGQNLAKISKPDTWITGYQIGTEASKFFPNRVRGDEGSAILGSHSHFAHNSETWDRMWQEIGLATSTEWQTQSRLVDMKTWGFEEEDSSWVPGIQGFEFCCRRVDGGAE